MNLPFAPLERHLRATHDDPRWDASVAASLLKVDRRHIHYLRHHGVNRWTADCLATRLGHHPSAIWGADWAQAFEPASLTTEEVA